MSNNNPARSMPMRDFFFGFALLSNGLFSAGFDSSSFGSFAGGGGAGEYALTGGVDSCGGGTIRESVFTGAGPESVCSVSEEGTNDAGAGSMGSGGTIVVMGGVGGTEVSEGVVVPAGVGVFD